MKKTILLISLFLLGACVSPQVAVNQNADFSDIKRVAVLTFSGTNGDVAADFMTQSLLMSGADVVERQRLSSVLQEHSLTESKYFDAGTAKQIGKLLGVDAMFVGTVVKYTDAGKYLVNTSKGRLITGVTEVNSSSIHSEGSVAGLPNSQILSTSASVSLMARMIDVQTGSVMWSASMSYEGFDIQTAMQAITDSFVHSLKSFWPALTK